MDGRGLWMDLKGPFSTRDAALKAAATAEHGNNEGQWKWNDHGTKSYKRCNRHVDCPVQLRAHQHSRGVWYLQVLDVAHGLELKAKKRANSALTFGQCAYVHAEAAKGRKPKEIMEGHWHDALQESQRTGIRLVKRSSGGIEGICACIEKYSYGLPRSQEGNRQQDSAMIRHETSRSGMNTDVSSCVCPGMQNNLAVWQREAKKARSSGANGKIEHTVDLRMWAEQHALPASLDAMQDFKTYAIPMRYHEYPAVEAVVLTSKVQVQWILQLLRAGRKWILHIDGKHKLHQGGWLLVTMGTHAVERKDEARSRHHKSKIVHTFRPLVYMFSKHHEDEDSLHFCMKAMELVVRMCAAPPPPLIPSNHADDTPDTWL